MDLLNTIKVEYAQHKKFLYKKLTTYVMISIKNKVKSNQVIKDNFVVKINELVEVENKTAVFQIMFPAVSQLCFHFCKQVSRV